MKRALVFLCVAAAAAFSGTAGAVSHDQVVPAHALRAFDGTSTSLESLRGQVVVLNFWASWCAPCRQELRLLQDWSKALDPSRTRVLAVSIDRDARKAKKFVKETGLDLPFFHDGPEGLAKSLDIPALPCTVVLDRSGKIVHVAEGSRAETLQELRVVVERISQQPATTTAQAEGNG
ncbi:MAG TPA: TlpA disulfide reductase family protein [bacterium]|nr:TlpA disulfide reductase family protein [bacterium]